MGLKLTDYLVGILLVGSLVTIFMLALADGSTRYSTSYDNSTFSSYQNKTAQIYAITADVNNQTSSISTDQTIFDIIGSAFSQGFVAIKATYASVDLMTDMVSEATSQLALGPAAPVVKTLIISVVAVLIFIGIVAAFILKWPV